ncbi:hypothetical protein RQP46_000990 [Phenoliferia psychrophenolica]
MSNQTAAELAAINSTSAISDSPPSTAPGSPTGFAGLASLPGSRPISPMSTPGSSRPPSPLLKAMGALQMNPMTQSSADSVAQGVDSEGKPIMRKLSVKKAPKPRRGSSPAMVPFLAKFDPMDGTGKTEKVAVIGSGSWGTALARLAAINAVEKEGFDETVNMWVRQREIPGKGLLTDLINETHENSRYLPQMVLPDNLIAVPNIRDVVKDATLIIFCVPHQFLGPVIAELSQPGVLTKGARALSAIKGIEVDLKSIDIYTYPSIIESKLGLPCSALGGANIALEVANQEFCETTIGCPGPEDAAKWHAVFDTQMFRVHCVEDVAGVSLSGALKNVVALAAGFVDGMNLGGNTKAAILRIGLLEMSTFTLEFFPSSSPQTFSHHSAGVADLITTSFGGRNRKCAEAFIRTGKTFPELEAELLNGQKLQGTVTAEEIFKFLEARGRLDGYPLFEKVYRISFEGLDPKQMFEDL